MSVRKFEIYKQVECGEIFYLGGYLLPGESVQKIKIKGLMPDCDYTLKHNNRHDMFIYKCFSYEYECIGATKFYMEKMCFCNFEKTIRLIIYCTK
jgi:hypothetical protein